MEKQTSLQPKLTEHWQQHLETCREGVRLAETNLARIAIIYSGQLRLEFENEA